MRLTRRDAVAALVTGGAAGAVASVFPTDVVESARTDRTPQFTDTDIRELAAVAEVVFPSAIEVTPEYVEGVVSGLPADRRRGLGSTLDRLERYMLDAYGTSLADLPVERRELVLRSLGVDRAGSSPDGSLPQRVRFYIVNQFLYALYTTPRGTGLVGIDNPVGYPGGYDSYQQPPTDE